MLNCNRTGFSFFYNMIRDTIYHVSATLLNQMKFTKKKKLIKISLFSFHFSLDEELRWVEIVKMYTKFKEKQKQKLLLN